MSTDHILLSIIIPAYNTGNYIADCLESIYRQEIKNFEVICVDDGSTDNTAEVLESFSKRYDNLVIVKKENGGLAAARNFGLSFAQGKYIYFMDSDDTLAERCLGQTLERCEKYDLDMLCFSFENFYDSEEMAAKSANTVGTNIRKGVYPEEILPGRELLVRFVKNEDWNSSACINVVRKELIDKNNIKFHEILKCSEDFPYSFAIYMSAERVLYVNEAWYKRRLRVGSIIHSDTTPEYLVGVIRSLKIVFNESKKYDDVDEETGKAIGLLMQKYFLHFARRYSKASSETIEHMYSLFSVDDIIFYDSFYTIYLRQKNRLLKKKEECVKRQEKELVLMTKIRKLKSENLNLKKDNAALRGQIRDMRSSYAFRTGTAILTPLRVIKKHFV